MKDKLDLDIKTELTDSKPQIPDGYYEKVRKNLKELENTRTNGIKSIGMLRIACTLAIFSGSWSRNYLCGNKLQK